jgi:dihydroflavonol-4-reductase
VILVTGGTGFVGHAVIQELVAASHPVRVLSRNVHPATESPLSWVQGDVTSLADLKRAINGCTQIFHCAGEKTDQRQMAPVNVVATRVLFDLAVDSNVSFFCHLSSVGTVGLTDRRVVDESASCNPMNLYEQTKLEAERIVSRGLSGGKVVIVRPTNVFGAETLKPWMRDSVSARIQRFVKGKEHAHLVYVKDVAAAVVYVFGNSPAIPVSTYIVSSDEEGGNTYREIQARLASTIPGAPAPTAISAPIFIPRWIRRARNGRSIRGDIIYSAKKLRDLGFQFPFGLERGLRESAILLQSSSGPPSRRSDSQWLPPSWA